MKLFKLFLFVMAIQISLFAQGIIISNNSVFNLGSAVLKVSCNWLNNGTVNTSNGTISFMDASGNQTYTDENNSPINNLIINKATGEVLLMDNITINGILTCTSGDLNLNGKIILLGNSANVNEAASATVSGTSGHIETTRTLNNPSNNNVAGLGFTITSAENLGSTRIVRTHKALTTNTNGSVKRAFDVTPTTNTNLNATIVFSYDDDEINGLNETDLQLYKSTDNGLTWLTQGGVLNTTNNTVTLSGVQDFSLWTLGVNEGPVISNAGGKINCSENSEVEVFNAIMHSDPDDINCESAVLQITGNYVQDEDVLSFTDQNGITGVWNNTTGRLTLSGSASKDDYVAAIRSVMYKNGSTQATELTRTISIYTNDGNDNSNTLTRDIEVTEMNNVPTLVVNNNGSVTEGGSFIISDQFLKANDIDGNISSITFNVIEEPKYGILSFNRALLKKGSSFTFTQNDIANGKLNYTHNSGEESSDNFQFYLSDDRGSKSDNFTYTINITGKNDPPFVDTLSGIKFNEDEEYILKIEEWYDCLEDPDDEDSTLTFSVLCTNENMEFTQLSDTSYKITTLPDYFGNDSLHVVFYDKSGDSCSAKTSIQILPINDPPVFIDFPGSVSITSGVPESLQMHEYLQDVETPDSLLDISFETENESIFCSYKSQTGIITLLATGTFSGDVNITLKLIDAEGGMSETVLHVNVTQNVTDIVDSDEIPDDYTLFQNYPNPFNPSTKIRYGVPAESDNSSSNILLKIYDILGNEVATLVNENQNPGYYEYSWNGQGYSSGIYFYTLSVQGNKNLRIVKKMILVK